MKLPSYPKYKLTGVKWLEEVPENWEVYKLRNVCKIKTSNVDKLWKNDEQIVRLCNYVDVYKNDRIFSRMDFMSATATSEEIERFRLQVDDVLITKDSETWNDIAVPALVEETADDIVSGYHLALLRPFAKLVNGGYLFRVLQSMPVSQQFHVTANGVTRYGLSQSAIKSVQLPLPSLVEQAIIKNFLDHVAAKIDKLVAKKQILIERIREKRIALISHAITHGLPADATQLSDLSLASKRKPSGIQWLGDIPEHWDVLRLKYVASINDEALTETTDPSFEMSYVDIGSVDPIRGIVSSEEMIFEDAPSRARRIVRDGDTIISTVRTYLRAIAPVRNPEKKNMIVSTGFAVVRPREISPRFLAYLLSDPRFVSEIMARSVGVSYPAVNAADIGNISIAVPGRIEQESIAEFLDRETARLDTIVSEVEIAIRRLGEYRNALVTAAVTGKIDVRKVEQAVVDNGTER